ncbi:MAG: ring-cleaving dioxygenase [Bryobacteraceae bacterium]|nr:ring-cleaving dioxygenase [Bryobacteraceae bacterium]
MSERPSSPQIGGIHHVTAIASAPQPNLDFYIRFLGLRLVKRTVNFDDPQTYHFYYGDETGRPGTILTFFPWPGARPGRTGNGMVSTTSFAVPLESLDFWQERARQFGFPGTAGSDRFSQQVFRLTDGDGLATELIASTAPRDSKRPDGVEIPSEFEIQCIHSATLNQQADQPTIDLLTNTMGFRETGREGDRIRLEVGEGGPGATIDLLIDPNAARGSSGAGTVHHIAFRTPDDVQQTAWLNKLTAEGHQVSPVMDRNYFHSIYYREPGGVLFEIATDPPGFLIDESVDELGSHLKLPPEYESMRSQIEAALPAITVPSSGTLAESY